MPINPETTSSGSKSPIAGNGNANHQMFLVHLVFLFAQNNTTEKHNLYFRIYLKLDKPYVKKREPCLVTQASRLFMELFRQLPNERSEPIVQ